MNTLSLSVSNPSRREGSGLRNSPSTSVSARCSRRTLRPARGDVGQHQGLHEAAPRDRPTMGHQIRLDKSRRRIVPAIKRAHRHAAPDRYRRSRQAARRCSRLPPDITQRPIDRHRAHRRVLVRTSGTSCRWPCRSMASTRIGSSTPKSAMRCSTATGSSAWRSLPIGCISANVVMRCSQRASSRFWTASSLPPAPAARPDELHYAGPIAADLSSRPGSSFCPCLTRELLPVEPDVFHARAV
jgi:hypothetical protein